MNTKFCGMLGLSMRAGKLACGEAAAEEAIRGGTAKLLILAADASGNTEKKFLNMANHHQIEVIRPGDRRAIGSAIGRAAAVTVAVTDRGLADQLSRLAAVTDERQTRR